jgi:hypothetical protein
VYAWPTLMFVCRCLIGGTRDLDRMSPYRNGQQLASSCESLSSGVIYFIIRIVLVKPKYVPLVSFTRLSPLDYI